jgi:hypothetical protein
MLLPRVVIIKTGEKFPPLKNNADTSPDTAVVSTTRRNGQVIHTRRVLQPTLVPCDTNIFLPMPDPIVVVSLTFLICVLLSFKFASAWETLTDQHLPTEV